MSDFVPDKSKMKDSKNTYLTMMLFVETSTDLSRAMYSLTDRDKEKDGMTFISLRRLYLEMEDPSEYEFANKYLWGWDHWQKIVANRDLYDEIRKWREELEVKLRARGIRSVIEQAGKNFNAAKWVADGHWNVKRGRPSKEEIERERRVRERAVADAQTDAGRVADMMAFQKNRKDNGTS